MHRCLCLLPQPDVLLATGLRLEEAEAAALREEALLPEGQRLASAEHPGRHLLDVVVEEGLAHAIGQVLEVFVPRDDGVSLGL